MPAFLWLMYCSQGNNCRWWRDERTWSLGFVSGHHDNDLLWIWTTLRQQLSVENIAAVCTLLSAWLLFWSANVALPLDWSAAWLTNTTGTVPGSHHTSIKRVKVLIIYIGSIGTIPPLIIGPIHGSYKQRLKHINPHKVPNYTAWWTEAHWCEQLAQGCCPTMQRLYGSRTHDLPIASPAP